MTGPRVTVRIDRLRVRGPHGDAAALAEALRMEIAAQIAANPALGAQGAETLQVQVPRTTGAAALGRQAGSQIASALCRPKGDSP